MIGPFQMDEHTLRLMNFDIDFTDLSGKDWINYGCEITDEKSAWVGAKSLHVKNTSNYLMTNYNSNDLKLSKTDLTIEYILYSDVTTYGYYLFGLLNPNNTGNPANNGLCLGSNNRTTFMDYIANGTTWGLLHQSSYPKIDGQFAHYALTRNLESGLITRYVNGKIFDQFSYSGKLLASDLYTWEDPNIDKAAQATLGNLSNTYINGFRISTVDRYSGQEFSDLFNIIKPSAQSYFMGI